jgi:type VI protein secretion system component VasK
MTFCAEALGFMVGRWRLVAVLYILVFFFVVPLVLLILSWIHIAVAVVFGILMGVGIGAGMVLLYRRLKRQAAQEEREKNIEIGDARNNMEITDEVDENVEKIVHQL